MRPGGPGRPSVMATAPISQPPDRAADLFTDGLSAACNSADRFTILVSLYDRARARCRELTGTNQE